MKQIKIDVPKGYEVDFEESNLKIGLIKFREVKKELPKSWNELKYIQGYYMDFDCTLHNFKGEPTKYDKNVFGTEEQAEASIALAQLSQLREVYRQGWKPDWNDNKKYGIILHRDKFIKTTCYEHSHFLVFQTEEIRDLFFENFKDLIEQAKPLMS